MGNIDMVVGLIAKKNGMDVGVAIHLSSFAKHKKKNNRKQGQAGLLILKGGANIYRLCS